MKTVCIALFAALVLTGVSPSLANTTFFNNYPFSHHVAWFVCDAGQCGRTLSPAFRFVSNATGLTSYVAAPAPDNLRVLLRADDNGFPGRVLAKKNLTHRQCCKAIRIKMSVDLTAGTPYWLELAPGSNTDDAWLVSKSSTDRCIVAEPNGTGWSEIKTHKCPAVKIRGIIGK